LLADQVTTYYLPLDENRMQEAGSYLLGQHDFTSFRAVQCQARSPVREIQFLKVRRQGRFIFLDIQANGFLHHMVRNIVGVLLKIGSGQQPPEWIKTVLDAQDRRCADVTASPDGLYFMRALYPAEFDLSCQLEQTFLCLD